MIPDRETLVSRVADAISTALLLATDGGAVMWHNTTLIAMLGDAAPEQLQVLVAAGVRPEGPPVDLVRSSFDRREDDSAQPSEPLWIRATCLRLDDLLLYEIREITEARRVEERLSYLTKHDPLTGLVNRSTLTDRLAQLLSRDDPESASGGLLIIDIDNFKDINDVRGHAVGDEVMRRLARLLVKTLPAASVLGRLGGDEFGVVLPHGDAAEILAAGQSLCDAAANTPLVIFGDALRVTLSVGVAPADGEQDCEVLFASADLGLDEAKTAGRNRACLFAQEQYRDAVQRVNVVRRVREALHASSLELDAQPIVDLATGTTTSYELLVRLRDGVYPMVGPAEFLPTLEQSDLVRELDRWVIEQATVALAQPAAIRARLCLDVNVSSRSMDDPTFGEWVVSHLTDLGIDPPRLGLEITETTAISNLDAARRLASTLTAAGCRFSLDDFGAGFGSFVYLKNLPFTTVKIAGDFVRQADAGGVDSVLVDAVVRAATGLGMTTVAEYVDREPLVAALRDLGVDRGQGYHLGKPAPLSLLVAHTQTPTQRLPRPRRSGNMRALPAVARGVASGITQRTTPLQHRG